MTSQSDTRSLEIILETAADKLGDVTPLVLQRYYERFPEAKQIFLDLGYGNEKNLEASMVDSALYCMMTWFEQPAVVKNMLANANPQHQYWSVPLEQVIQLQIAVFDVVEGALDADDLHLKAVVGNVRRELVAAIEEVSKSL